MAHLPLVNYRTVLFCIARFNQMFVLAQLNALRKTLYSKIICQNGDDFKMIHSKVFLLNSDRWVGSSLISYRDTIFLLTKQKYCANVSTSKLITVFCRSAELELQPCQNISDIDLRPWKE